MPKGVERKASGIFDGDDESEEDDAADLDDQFSMPDTKVRIFLYCAQLASMALTMRAECLPSLIHLATGEDEHTGSPG